MSRSKRMGRRICHWAGAAALATLAAGPAAAEVLSPADVLRGAWKLDGTSVKVMGTLRDARHWSAPGGTRYYRFDLAEGNVRLPVLARAGTRCADNRLATVNGVVRRIFVVDGEIFRRLVEATSIECGAPEGEREPGR